MDFNAEREGFEPPVPRGTTVFKTAAFDHSAISPERDKSRTYFLTTKGIKQKKYKIAQKKIDDLLFFKNIFLNLAKPVKRALKLLILLAFQKK